MSLRVRDPEIPTVPPASASPPPAVPPPRSGAEATSVALLAGLLVLYLGLVAGGYDIVLRSQAGVIVWWVVLCGAGVGLLPFGRLTRAAWTALGLFGAFTLWTALATTWSLSSERSLQELSRVAFYLGILLLAVSIQRTRERAFRYATRAVAAAIVLLAALAVVSRLQPDLFPQAQATHAALPGSQGRLDWPLNYWNALAALVAIGIPLNLSIATSASQSLVRCLAAGTTPILILCEYLTFSRGGGIAVAAAGVVFFALTRDRLPKLISLIPMVAGGVALGVGATRRPAVEQGLTGSPAMHQGAGLLLALVLVCAGVGVAHVGISLLTREATWPRVPKFPRRIALSLAGVAVLVCIAVAVFADAPAIVSRAWHSFQRPSTALKQSSIGRFGSVGGNGRYDYWKVAIEANRGHPLIGSGPGTFQLLWLPRARHYDYVQNAHSLYVETYSDVGLIGLGLLVGFIATVLVVTVRVTVRARDEARTLGAGVAAALTAFCLAAALDWIWQVPTLPAAFLILGAAALAPGSGSVAPAGERTPAGRTRPPSRARWGRGLFRGSMVALSILSLAAIGFPLATAVNVRNSQRAAARGELRLALRDATAAARLEPGAASAQIQVALVRELQHDLPGALAAAHRAVGDEPQGWSGWVVLSRLEIEAGDPAAGAAALHRARALNPRSPYFSRVR